MLDAYANRHPLQLEMLPRVVPVEDEEISKELLRSFKKRGIDVGLSVKDTKIEKNKEGALVSWTDSNGKPQTKQAEKVLVAVGRSPRTADIGLDNTAQGAPERSRLTRGRNVFLNRHRQQLRRRRARRDP